MDIIYLAMKTKIKPYLFPKPYNNGEHPIYIQIYRNSKRSYVSVGYSIPLEAWNISKAEVWESKPKITKEDKETKTAEELKKLKRERHSAVILPNATKINSEIRHSITRLEDIQQEMEVHNQEITSASLKRLYENKDKNENAKKDFLKYIEDVSGRKYQNKQIRTSEKYIVLLRKLRKFTNDKPLPLEQLNTALLNEFQTYLVSEGCHINYVNVNMKALRTIVQKEAIQEDRIISPEKNPFIFYKMPKTIPTVKQKLNAAEVERIEALEYDVTDNRFHVRNLFLFAMYTAGTRIGDLLQFRWCNIKNGRIEYHMGKTGKFRSIKLLPDAQRILDIYEPQRNKETDYIFPFLSNNEKYSKLVTVDDFQKASPELTAYLYKKIESRIAVVNKGLKLIAINAKIQKKLSTHIARHSFADMARKKGLSVYDISNMLGHSSISITQKYLDSLDVEAMDSAMEEVFKK